MMSPHDEFLIPISLDLIAVFVMALIGAVAARRRGYDYIGVLMTGMVSGIGGSLLRDGIFLQQRPLAVSDSRYLLVIVLACLAGAMVSHVRRGITTALVMIDAFGLGAYAMIGTQASLDFGIAAPGAAVVGLLNAVGGGILRDIAIREEPLVFKPGEHYAGAALAGIMVFLALDAWGVSRVIGGVSGIVMVFAIRMASAWLGWRTRPLPTMGWIERN